MDIVSKARTAVNIKMCIGQKKVASSPKAAYNHSRGFDFGGIEQRMTIHERIAENTRSLRGRDKISQRGLAKLLGINKMRMSAIENAKAKIKVSELEKIAQFFGMTVPDFLSLDFSKGRRENVQEIYPHGVDSVSRVAEPGSDDLSEKQDADR